MTLAPSHIVIVTLENESFSEVIGNSAAPFLNQLVSEGMLFTNYDAIAHPSQPNYLALFSGSTQGVTNDTIPSTFPSSVPTLASALAAKGYTFAGYAESGADPAHAPWLDFANSTGDALNFSAFPTTAAGFANLPTVSFITPTNADNMTPTDDGGGGIAAGDQWLQTNLSAYATWAQANNSLLVITFDENDDDPAVTYPNQVATIVVGAGVPAGVTNNSPADQYSLLSTVESLYGLASIGVSGGAPPLNFYSSTPPTATATATASFSGISDPTNTPPENGLAVGPSAIVMAETSHYEVTNLNGVVNTAATGNGSLYSLFAPLGSTFDNALLDARVAYDSSTGRFVLIADNFQPGGGSFRTNIDIAVSNDSNPADGWSLAAIDTSNGGTTQSDMPYLSVSGGNIYLSAPEYLDAGGSGGTGEWVISESAVTGSTTITPSASNTASSAYGTMRNVAGANGVTFYVGAYSNGSQTILGYQTFSASGGFSAVQTIAVGDGDKGTGGNDYTAQQQGTGLTLDIGDSRIQSLAYAGGYLWGVSEIMPSGATAPEILWFKLNVSNPAAPVVVLQGAISGAAIGTGVAVFNPSIAVDQNGDVLINFSASGPNMYPSDYYTVLGANASSFSAPTLYQASNTYFNSGTLNDQRWGTYSTVVADPNNANGFWLSNEYVSTTVNGPGGAPGWWGTVTAQVQVNGSAPAAPTIADAADINGYVNAANDTAAQALTGTAGPNNTIAIYLNGATTAAYTTQANASGTWSQTIGVLANGTYSYTATAADAAGNLSAPSSPLVFTVDTTVPAAPTIADASDINGYVNAANDTATQALTGTAGASDTINIYLNGATTPAYTVQANAGGTWSQTIGVLANGNYSYIATATDQAGNVSAPSAPLAFTVNATGATMVTSSFSGISDPTNTPPENGLAVGASAIVMAETSHYEVTNLNGVVNTAATGNGSLYSLFAPLGSTFDNALLDARVAYDSSTGRFVLIAENFQPGGGNFRTDIDIAVSKDSNPADGWSLAAIDTSNGGTTQSDMPYLSVAGGNIYLSSPEYLDAGGYGGTGEWVISESSVTGSTTITPSASNIASSAYGIMRNIGGANGVTFYVGAYSNGSQTILGYQTSSASSGFSAVQTIAVGDSDKGTGGNDYTAQQQGTSLTLKIGDSRIQSLAYAGGYLWGVSEVMPSGAAAPQILWFKLNVSNPAAPAVVLQGDISGAAIGTGVAVFNPSIAVDQNGDVLINFSASGPNMYPSDYYTVLGAGASAFSAPTLYQASNTYFNSGNLNDQRWGTYSTVVADPNNANGFWLSNEYVSTTVNGPGGSPGWWDTVTAQVKVNGSAPAAPSIADASDINGYVNAANDTAAQALTGTAGSNNTIAIYLNGATTAAYTTQANASGTWSQTIGMLANGTYSYTATAADAAGNVSASSSPLVFTVDTTVPAAPTIADASDINGFVNAANDTATQALTGTAGASDTINIYLNGATTPAYTTQGNTGGNWSQTIGVLANGNYSYIATATDQAGNVSAPSAPLGFTVDTTAPAISSIATSGAGITNGGGDLDAGNIVTLTASFSETVNVNTTGGSPTLALNDGGAATYIGGSGTNALTFGYTVLSGQNTADLIISSLNLNGATIVDSVGNAANLAGATNVNPPGTLQIDTTPPTVTIGTIASNNIINATKAASGFKISGSTSGAENGQTVTVQIINAAQAVVDSYTTADLNNAWSVSVTSAQATALADGSYTVAANVSDKAGNPALQATHALTVDEDKSPEPPLLTIGSSSLTVAAGGSVPLGITATPVDSDDRLSVKIAGVPSYETITAPSGDSVSKQLQLNGTYTWTITESASAAGTAITGLTLKSNYKGTGHPIATFTITASNTTSGETAASAAQTIAVTDPPQIASSPPAGSNPLTVAISTTSNAALNHVAALFEQFVAAGFHSDQPGAGSITPPTPLGAIHDLTFLTHPQH